MQLKQDTELQNGKYRIIRVLGQGGFGITYLAEHTMLDKMVAIKEFFPKDYCDRDETTSTVTMGTRNNSELVTKLKRRFLKEAKNIAKLDHPGIVKIHDIFEENNTAYYVMDYIKGITLSEMVKLFGTLPEEKAIEYITKVGESLEYMHSNKMTHFDVKPANIIVADKSDMPVLIDFGLSKQYSQEGEETSTLLQAVSSGFSPIELYSPESFSEFSPQTDVYSLAATLYYLVTGNIPSTSTKLLEEGLSLPTNISQTNQAAIKKGMSASRVNRPQSINAFLNLVQTPRSPTINNSLTNSTSSEENTVIINPQTETPKSTRNPNTNSKTLSNLNSNNNSSKIILIWITITIIVVLTAIFVVQKCSVQNPTDAATNHVVPSTDVNEHLTGTNNGHMWVDLGLPSGRKWAMCNVGATSPKEYGEYFAWGEINPKETYSLSNYQISNSIIDHGGTLSSYFDVVTMNWGNDWRMPTKEEFEELLKECSWNWSDNNNGYNVIGPNGASIFLPASGYRLNKSFNEVGEIGRYWCSTTGQIESDHDEISNFYGLSDVLCLYNPNLGNYFLKETKGSRYIYHAAIYYGFSIRGVRN